MLLSPDALFTLLKVDEVQGNAFSVAFCVLKQMVWYEMRLLKWPQIYTSVHFISHNAAFVNPEVLEQTDACCLFRQMRFNQAVCQHQH